MRKVIVFLFNFLFITVPLIFYPWTSEVFEFNKIVLVYLITILITGSWLARMVIEKKFIFRHTIMDIPLGLFLFVQIVSTFFSIDPHTSVFGYYSRFHGGLLSSTAYLLLYWSYVSNMDRKDVLLNIKSLLFSGVIISIYAILEHFGHSPSCLVITGKFNVDCWVQDVATRVFATMGQPNWLAALLAATLPLAIYNLQFTISNQTHKSKILNPKSLFWLSISLFLFIALLFTKSRSGLLGFGVASVIYWTLQIKKSFKQFLLFNISFLILALAIGTPFTPAFKNLITKNSLKIENSKLENSPSGPALETGGTESGEIRKIVWKGAVEIVKHFPILGTGPETFAYSYYQFRPVEHNLVSEWDFLYNKAHNEYLNIAANTGIVGLLSYLLVIAFSFVQIVKNSPKIENSYLKIALAASYASILVTNFFGFSVVATSLLFFLFPAFAVTLQISNTNNQLPKSKDLDKIQKIFLGLLAFVVCYLSFVISQYWYGDFLYAKSKTESSQGKIIESARLLGKALAINSSEAIYHDELAKNYVAIAVVLAENKNSAESIQFISSAVEETKLAEKLSPRNVNLARSRANIYTELSGLDSNYLTFAISTLEKLTVYAPTDAKAFYKLAVTYAKNKNTPKAIEILVKTIQMKPNYKDARFTLALIYATKGENKLAVEQLEYIVDKIDPKDQGVQKQLDLLTK